MTSEELEDELDEFFFSLKTPKLKGDIEEAAYTLSEAGFMDNEDGNFLIDCWKVVEKLRVSEFPEELKV